MEPRTAVKMFHEVMAMGQLTSKARRARAYQVLAEITRMVLAAGETIVWNHGKGVLVFWNGASVDLGYRDGPTTDDRVMVSIQGHPHAYILSEEMSSGYEFRPDVPVPGLDQILERARELREQAFAGQKSLTVEETVAFFDKQEAIYLSLCK